MRVYKYGLTNTLEAIEDALTDALNTNNKNEKVRYISEAYGMIRAINSIYEEEEELELKTEDNT